MAGRGRLQDKKTPVEKLTYSSAGVDLDAAGQAKERLKAHVRSTFGPQVLADIGLFSGLFQLKGYRDPVLSASTDGVGTKVKIAQAMGRHHSIGLDLVHHCVNDILTSGARPLFFLDYIGLGKMNPKVVEAIVSGIAKACRGVGCALIGGETAEMPGTYKPGDYDVAGFIVGAVERDEVIDESRIRVGDVLLGLPSSGLHTNGYSLVRRIFNLDENPKALEKRYTELGRTLGEELLEPHRCYLKEVGPVLRRVKGLAHITGGGLPGNVPRVLPKGLTAKFKEGSWPVPPIFGIIQRRGQVDKEEMYRVFNMGLGMVVAAAPADADALLQALPGAMVVGEVGREP
ncbi:MAG: phosphoribosylformylglycinamidine cyclo-ligase [Chloroflexi bacterium]|nr:phosphoribosylformylglycinamidine cyclo-ligase [Chloroflexota bacterium]